MQRTMMKSKIHRATVTAADLNYIGSITIDRDLMDASDLLEFERVHVLDIDNGARFETYVIEGERGSGTMQVNGAAARLVHKGDKLIVISYAGYADDELESYRPIVVQVDDSNAITENRLHVEIPLSTRTDSHEGESKAAFVDSGAAG